MSEKKTPQQWSIEEDVLILDPDGWRMPDAPEWDEPIDYLEWSWRSAISTQTKRSYAEAQGWTIPDGL